MDNTIDFLDVVAHANCIIEEHCDDSYNSLKHYGTPNMHWGDRRYQYTNGSLTPLGRIHYGVGEARNKLKNKFDKSSNLDKKIEKAKDRKEIRDKKNELDKLKNKEMNIKDMSDDDIRKEINRLKAERELEDLRRNKGKTTDEINNERNKKQAAERLQNQLEEQRMRDRETLKADKKRKNAEILGELKKKAATKIGEKILDELLKSEGDKLKSEADKAKNEFEKEESKLKLKLLTGNDKERNEANDRLDDLYRRKDNKKSEWQKQKSDREKETSEQNKEETKKSSDDKKAAKEQERKEKREQREIKREENRQKKKEQREAAQMERNIKKTIVPVDPSAGSIANNLRKAYNNDPEWFKQNASYIASSAGKTSIDIGKKLSDDSSSSKYSDVMKELGDRFISAGQASIDVSRSIDSSKGNNKKLEDEISDRRKKN